MTSEHFDQVFETLQLRSPFRPYTVELVGGKRFEVDHPLAMVVRDGVAVFLAPGGTPIFFDHDSVNQVVAEITGGPPA